MRTKFYGVIWSEQYLLSPHLSTRARPRSISLLQILPTTTLISALRSPDCRFSIFSKSMSYSLTVDSLVPQADILNMIWMSSGVKPQFSKNLLFRQESQEHRWWQQEARMHPLIFVFMRARTEISRAPPHMCLQTPTICSQLSQAASFLGSRLGLLSRAVQAIVSGSLLTSKSETSLLYLWKQGLAFMNLSNLFRLVSRQSSTFLLILFSYFLTRSAR